MKTMRIYVYFGLFLCLTLARCGNEKGNKRKKMDNVDSYETNEDNASECHQSKKSKVFDVYNAYPMTVEMGDDTDDQTPKQNIVIYHGSKNKVDSLYASYTAINCKSALWVVRKINNFINQNMPIVKSTFDTNLEEFASVVWSNVDRFISILLHFLEKISDSSFYMDKSVLKAFVSLKIKLSVMISRRNFIEMGINQTQEEIIELLLVEIFELQRYSSVHCDYTTMRASTIPDYFRVWVFVDGLNDDDKSMQAFLRITAKTGLEPNGPLNDCHARQILLEDIVNIRGTDEISSTVLNAISHEGSQKGFTITIREIAHRMLVSYDMDVYSWYHDLVLAAIMKLLCLVASMSENALSFVAKHKIGEINKKILVDNDDLPAYFTEGFDLLRKNGNTLELILYFDRLRDLYVKPSTDQLTELADQLLERILEHFDQITCAEKYLKHLRGENEKYYTPGSHNRYTLLADYSRSDELAYATDLQTPTACKFVMCLYIHANFNSEMDSKTVNVTMMRAMKNILELSILAIHYESDNWHLRRTAYDVAVMLRNQQLGNRISKQKFLLYKRVMNRVMTELNVYWTKYCRTVTQKYLENKSDVMRYKDGRALRAFMRRFFEVRYDVTLPDLEGTTLEDGNDRYFRVESLYENYVKESKVVKRYSNVVRVYWNRQLLSVDVVFAESMNMTLDPRNVYALYDVYNKFFLAVIFHTVRRAILVGSDYEYLELALTILKRAFNFNEFHDVFPDGLAALKTDLSTIFSFPYTQNVDNMATSQTSESDAMNKLRNAMSDAVVKFAQYNFVINEDADEPSTSYMTLLNDDSFPRLLHNEVNILVREFNKKFQQLSRFY